jgi:hypothetical protein
MSVFSNSLWSYLVQRGGLSTSQFEGAFGALVHLLPYTVDDEYNEFRTARNVLRLWHAAGWLEYDYEAEKVLPRKPTLIGFKEGGRDRVSLVAVNQAQSKAFADKHSIVLASPRLDDKISEMYPPIYQTDLKPAMSPDFRADDLLATTPGRDEILSVTGGAPYANVQIFRDVPKLVDLDNRKKFYFDTSELYFKEGEPAQLGNYLIRYRSSVNYETDCIWRQLIPPGLPVNRQFRVIEEWAWGMHIALAESTRPATVMYDPLKKTLASYMQVPLPRAISRLLAWHGGQPLGFLPLWNDPLRGGCHSLYLYSNVTHALALAIASKLGYRQDRKPLRLIVL